MSDNDINIGHASRNRNPRGFENAFRKLLASIDLMVPSELKADGRPQYVDVINHDHGRNDGRYCLHVEGQRVWGWCKNWITGQKKSFVFDDGRPFTKAEQREIGARIQEERRRDYAERRKEGARKATAIWRAAKPAPDDHPYLTRKQLKGHGLRVYKLPSDFPIDDCMKIGPVIVVPIYDEDENLLSLQFINDAGVKRFLTGAVSQGGHFWVADPDDVKKNAPICIAEGWAKGERIYQVTKYAVVVAFGSGNLKAIAEWVREQYPDADIIICADDDWKQKGNPGLSAATDAALAIDASLAVPKFKADRHDDHTDFADMYRAVGPEAVKQAIDGATKPRDTREPDEDRGEHHQCQIDELAALDAVEYDRARDKVAAELGVRKSTLDKLVERRRAELRREEPDEPPDIDELAASCQHIIDCHDVLSMFTDECSRVVAGEESLLKLLYLSATSRLFDKAMHVAIKGPSAGGKSEIRKRVLSFFPPESVIQFTALSEKALLYFVDDFSHKVLSMGEAFNPEETKFQDYVLRELMSEGVLRYPVVQKQDGELATVTIEKHGPVAFMVTTTRNKLHPENETRMLSLEVDDGAGQTGKVMKMVAEVEGLNRTVDQNIFAAWHDYQRWLAAGECRVHIPFAEVLAELVEGVSVRLRRDFGQLLLGMKAHALLHREHRRRSKQGRIVATIEDDYVAVRKLIANLMATASGIKMSKGVAETVKVIRQLEDAVDPRTKPAREAVDMEGIPVRDIAETLDLDLSTTRRRLAACVSAGVAINLEIHAYRPGRYATTGEHRASINLLPSVDELLDAYEDSRRNDDFSSSRTQREKPSTTHSHKARH